MEYLTKKNTIHRAIFFVISLLIISCDGKEDPTPNDGNENDDPCKNGPELSVSIIFHSYTGQSTGLIKASVSGGNGEVAYSFDGMDFSSENTFDSLPAGNYTITVQDDSLCTAAESVEIFEFPEISFSNDVFPIIEANCRVSGCHGDTGGIPTWENYSIIKANAERIRFRVTGKSMPPSTSGFSLSDDEIMTIQNWVDVGAPNN